MTSSHLNSFQDLFDNQYYLFLKNDLYSYRLRKRAIEKTLSSDDMSLTLEVGSGISPMMTITDRIVYTDLSFSAVRMLRQNQRKGWYVVADAMNLPFRRMSFSHVIASEVIEHLPDDHGALQEMAAVLKPSGRFIITFPHRHFYFTLDDRFVHHFRRYELHEISNLLEWSGLLPIVVKKVLGPLEKLTMMATIGAVHLSGKFKSQNAIAGKESHGLDRLAPFFKWGNRLYAGLVWLDAKIMPRNLSTVLLIMAEKRK